MPTGAWVLSKGLAGWYLARQPSYQLGGGSFFGCFWFLFLLSSCLCLLEGGKEFIRCGAQHFYQLALIPGKRFETSTFPDMHRLLMHPYYLRKLALREHGPLSQVFEGRHISDKLLIARLSVCL